MYEKYDFSFCMLESSNNMRFYTAEIRRNDNCINTFTFNPDNKDLRFPGLMLVKISSVDINLSAVKYPYDILEFNVVENKSEVGI